MLIYLAGNALIPERDGFIFDLMKKRLFSYFFHKPDGLAYMDFEFWKEKMNEDISSRRTWRK